MSEKSTWLDQPTESGYWWVNYGGNEGPSIVLVELQSGRNVFMGVGTDQETFLEQVKGAHWQKVKPFAP